MSELKRCPKCKSWLDKEVGFHNNRTKPDGKECWCKTCKRKDSAARRMACYDWIESELEHGMICCKTGEVHWTLLEFHHITGEDEKEFNISDYAKGWKGKKDLIKAELAKCVVLSVVCHRLYHAWIQALKMPLGRASLDEYLSIPDKVIKWEIDVARDANRAEPMMKENKYSPQPSKVNSIGTQRQEVYSARPTGRPL